MSKAAEAAEVAVAAVRKHSEQQEQIRRPEWMECFNFAQDELRERCVVSLIFHFTHLHFLFLPLSLSLPFSLPLSLSHLHTQPTSIVSSCLSVTQPASPSLKV